MKKISTILFLLLLSPTAAYTAELSVESKITDVVVYQDRALVTRSGEVTLEKGDNVLLFENLPAALIEESLRTEGRGSGAVSIRGAELKKSFGAEESNPAAEKLSRELELLQDEHKKLLSALQVLNEHKAFLDSIRNFSSAKISEEIVTKSPTPTEWSGTSQYLQSEYTQNGLKKIETEAAVREKQRQVDAKQRELSQIWDNNETGKKTVLVNVTAAEKCTFTTSLSYIVPQAQWFISYDAKAYPDKKLCRLTSYGNIRQWTGEDWNQARLTLSSAKPSLGGKMPELDSWFVNYYEPTPVPSQLRRAYSEMAFERKDAKSEEAGDYFLSASAVPQAARVEAKTIEAVVSQEQGAVTFEIPQPMTVLSDNRHYKSPIKTEEFSVELDYETTPKLSPYVFLHSKIVNNKAYILSAGELNIFVNDNFIGKSGIKTIGPGESFDVYLGIDEQIKVKRTELVDKRKKTLLGLRTRKDYGYKFELENYKSENIRLTVYDQIPVSKNAEIKVVLSEQGLKPTETKDLGILKWSLDLTPQEKKSFEFSFFIDHPSDKTVAGI